jgi:NAD(P)-dependent dehydrogenase (short-subunit alcohol dehydrogenase family)
MHEEFRDKVVVVTGASNGIGRATAEWFVNAGARVVGFARSADTLAALAAKSDGRLHGVAGDVSDADAIDLLFRETESRFGSCDILVNCAGMIDPRPLVETPPEAWDRMFAVNVRGTYLACCRALGAMLERGGGCIVNVASISGVPGPEKFPGFVSYCASKAAVISLTEALAVEIAGRGVRVNCVSPGSVDTAMWATASGGAPANMTPAEVAESIAYLASRASRPMNGQNLALW